MRATTRHITQLNIDAELLGDIADKHGYIWRDCNGSHTRMSTYFAIYNPANAHNRHPHMGNYYT